MHNAPSTPHHSFEGIVAHLDGDEGEQTQNPKAEKDIPLSRCRTSLQHLLKR